MLQLAYKEVQFLSFFAYRHLRLTDTTSVYASLLLVNLELNRVNALGRCVQPNSIELTVASCEFREVWNLARSTIKQGLKALFLKLYRNLE
jgi:hypothetical protein